MILVPNNLNRNYNHPILYDIYAILFLLELLIKKNIYACFANIYEKPKEIPYGLKA